MSTTTGVRTALPHRRQLQLSEKASRLKQFGALAGRGLLLAVASSSVFAVLFILFFVARDAIPFFRLQGFREFFTSTQYYPSGSPPSYGALAIFFGSALVTLGAVVVAVPLGVVAAVCLSDILPFGLRQVLKPLVEILAAIPSVAYGFFALVVFAPLLQEHGGPILAAGAWLLGAPLAVVAAIAFSDLAASMFAEERRPAVRMVVAMAIGGLGVVSLAILGRRLFAIQIPSGTNALNVSIILGIMALPTVVSVSEDALHAVGRELREGAYALGATRTETVMKVVIPAARGGITAAVLLGVMRAVGETMVVWMASGNAVQIPKPWYNVLQPVRTLTATVAGDMGEADHVTGSARYHVLFAMALCLLAFSFVCNLVSEWVMRRSRK